MVVVVLVEPVGLGELEVQRSLESIPVELEVGQDLVLPEYQIFLGLLQEPATVL